METLDELKAIRDNAPEGATHIDCDDDYVKFIDDEMYYYSFVRGYGWSGDYVSPCELRSLSDVKRIIELMEVNQSLQNKINQLDKAITDIGKHIQKSEPSFSMAGVDIGDSQKRIIEYIRKLEVL